MEVERRLSSIQWKITRSFVVATMASALLLNLIIGLLWFITSLWQEGREWFIESFGIEPNANKILQFMLAIILVSMLTAVMGGSILGFYNGRKLKKSLQELSWAAEKLTRGELAYRITISGSDEIAELSDQFNNMASRIESQVLTLQKLVQENAELHQQASQVAVHEERQRLARELHDSISQQLFAIMMSMAACNRLLDKDTERAKKQFIQIEEMAAQTQAEMRALLLHLRPVQLEGKRLSAALQELLEELNQKHSIDYEWDIEEIQEIPLGLEEHIFRISQEGISNALRHSHAKKILLSLKKRKTTLILSITDDGIGFKHSPDRASSSMGLGNIAERVTEMGGVWEILSVEGRGTTVEIRVPLLTKGEASVE